MHRLRRFVGLAALAATLGASAVSVSANDDLIVGLWQSEGGTRVEIAPCPTGYCGFIRHIVVPDHIRAELGAELAALDVSQYYDDRNKDPALRRRPMLGLQILTFRPSSQPLAYEGTIYNPEDGETYSGRLEVLDTATVRLSGCVLFDLLCRGEDWMRVN